MRDRETGVSRTQDGKKKNRGTETDEGKIEVQMDIGTEEG